MADEPGLLVCAAVILAILLLITVGIRRFRRQQAAYHYVKQLRQHQATLLCTLPWNGRFQISVMNGDRSRWVSPVIVVAPEGIAFYPVGDLEHPLTFSPDQVRWFGRPKKYSYGMNEIWLHLETGADWRLLKIRLYRDLMRDFVRALKQIMPDELVTAYRRRRPYIHEGPVQAQPAAQDIHGAWTLDAPVALYLMPRFLVVLHGEEVLRKIPLEIVQQTGAFRRLDQPNADGLVRFRAQEETLAFALDRHDAFATALAEAAKRTLEAPIMQKQKKKEDEDFDDAD